MKFSRGGATLNLHFQYTSIEHIFLTLLKKLTGRTEVVVSFKKSDLQLIHGPLTCVDDILNIKGKPFENHT